MRKVSATRHGLARTLSKRGLCSRSEAERRIRDGRVAVDGRIVRDPEFPIEPGRQRIEVDGIPMESAAPAPVYLALNKPRGLVTTASDERGRDTVYRCFDDAGSGDARLPWIAPVGRLDKASEGLLLFSNDPTWAAGITDPATGPDKTYHVQVDAVPDEAALARMQGGIEVGGETLRARSVGLLRSGGRTAWLEIVLDEGRNRQIRRLLAASGFSVLRLVRIAIGDLTLGDLPKRGWRRLTALEAAALAPLARASDPGAR